MISGNNYIFKPSEIPPIAGSPAALQHSKSKKRRYFLIGAFLALTSGIQNGLLTASLPLLTGTLGLSQEQAGWVQVSYFMTYACMGVAFFKVRQHFGLYRFIRWMLLLMLLSNLLQSLQNNYYIELVARAILGIGTSGLFVTGMYYIMQAYDGPKKLNAVLINIGIMQLGMPLSQLMVPFLFHDGNMEAIFLFQLAMVLISSGLILRFPLPPSFIVKGITLQDLITFFCLAIGVALMCAFLVQGRIQWWTYSHLGYLLAGGIGFIGTAFLLDTTHDKPLFDWQLIFSPPMLMFVVTAGLTRLLTSELNVGVSGLLSSLGVGYTQLTPYYLIICSAAAFGAWLSVKNFNIQDLRRPVMLSMLGIAIASWLDTRSSIDSRPYQFYFSQALMSFSAFHFIGNIMIEGMVRTVARSVDRMPTFIVMIALSQTFGALTGMAIFNSVVKIQTNVHYANIAAQVTPTDPLVMQFLQQNSTAVLIQQMTKQATVEAYNDLFTLIATIATCAFCYLFIQWSYHRLRGENPLGKDIAAMGQNLRPQVPNEQK